MCGGYDLHALMYHCLLCGNVFTFKEINSAFYKAIVQ